MLLKKKIQEIIKNDNKRPWEIQSMSAEMKNKINCWETCWSWTFLPSDPFLRLTAAGRILQVPTVAEVQSMGSTCRWTQVRRKGKPRAFLPISIWWACSPLAASPPWLQVPLKACVLSYFQPLRSSNINFSLSPSSLRVVMVSCYWQVASLSLVWLLSSPITCTNNFQH